MTQEKNAQKTEPMKQFKSSYLELLDQTIELVVNQPIQASRKALETAIDAHNDLMTTLASAKTSMPVGEIIQAENRLLQAYSTQVQQGKEMATKGWNLFSEATAAWQRAIVEAQTSAADTYKTWFPAPKF
jgi:flagellar hook-basal body complex protein FliE